MCDLLNSKYTGPYREEKLTKDRMVKQLFMKYRLGFKYKHADN